MRGLNSIGNGFVAERHDTVFVYAQLYPESQPPARLGLSVPSSSDASCVLSRKCCAAIWSTETPERIPTPSVFFGWTPVSQTAPSRAWSPLPSPSALA